MRLPLWAKSQGIKYATAWRWIQRGQMPVPYHRTPSGSIFVDVPESENAKYVALYARVSSSDQKADLDRQLARLSQYASERHLFVGESIQEIGSGLNGHRKKLLAMLRNPKITTIIVEHKERLARFGFEYLEASLFASGRKILVLEKDDLHDESGNDTLVQDMIDVLTSFCARLYGRRSARHRIKNIQPFLEAK